MGRRFVITGGQYFPCLSFLHVCCPYSVQDLLSTSSILISAVDTMAQLRVQEVRREKNAK